MTATPLDDLAGIIRGWILSAVGGSPKVFFDRPIGNVTGLPRYSIIGPLTDNNAAFLGEKLDSSTDGSIHQFTYDIEVWSDNNKEAVVQTDKIINYIMTNRGLQETNMIHNVELVGINYRYENEVKIHRRILTIRVHYIYARS